MTASRIDDGTDGGMGRPCWRRGSGYSGRGHTLLEEGSSYGGTCAPWRRGRRRLWAEARRRLRWRRDGGGCVTTTRYLHGLIGVSAIEKNGERKEKGWVRFLKTINNNGRIKADVLNIKYVDHNKSRCS